MIIFFVHINSKENFFSEFISFESVVNIHQTLTKMVNVHSEKFMRDDASFTSYTI